MVRFIRENSISKNKTPFCGITTRNNENISARRINEKINEKSTENSLLKVEYSSHINEGNIIKLEGNSEYGFRKDDEFTSYFVSEIKTNLEKNNSWGFIIAKPIDKRAEEIFIKLSIQPTDYSNHSRLSVLEVSKLEEETNEGFKTGDNLMVNNIYIVSDTLLAELLEGIDSREIVATML